MNPPHPKPPVSKHPAFGTYNAVKGTFADGRGGWLTRAEYDAEVKKLHDYQKSQQGKLTRNKDSE